MKPPAVGGVGALGAGQAVCAHPWPSEDQSVSLFLLITAHVTELARPFDEAFLFIGVDALLD